MAGAAIIGCGMRTPLGRRRADSAAAVRAGIAMIAEHPWMIDRYGEPMRVTRDDGLPQDLAGAERLAALAIPAAREALERAPVSPGRMALLIGFAEARPGLTAQTCAAASARIADALSDHVPIAMTRHDMGGHAAGLSAMAAGLSLIETGRADLVLAGAVESYLDPETLEWLDETGQLHSEGNTYGFCPGEAAGFVLLSAKGSGARIEGAGRGTETNLIGTEDICLGEGLTNALRGAIRGLPDGQRIARILSDMNGERYRGNEYGFAALRCRDAFVNTAEFETPADCWGDVGAATGPLCAGLAMEAAARGYAAGPRTMIFASSANGRRAAVLLAAGEGA